MKNTVTISADLYNKILNLTTLPDVCDTNIDLYDADSDTTYNLTKLINDIREAL